MTVTKSRRTMLLISNVSGTATKFKPLYQWLDANAIAIGKLLVGRHYNRVSTMRGADVTATGFVTRARVLAKSAGCDALDVFLNVHGRPDSLRFVDGWTKMAEVRDRLQELNLDHRFRLLYSTACYGNDHAPLFVAAGFRTASGAVGVNANGPYDFQTQLRRWTGGETYERAVKDANNPTRMRIYDGIARLAGFDDVDSKKVVHGYRRLTIKSDAE